MTTKFSRRVIITTTWLSAFGTPPRSRFVRIESGRLQVWHDDHGYTADHGIDDETAAAIVLRVQKSWEIGTTYEAQE